VPFSFGLLGEQLEAERGEVALNGGEFPVEDSRKDYITRRLQLTGDPSALGDEQVRGQVGTDDIETGFGSERDLFQVHSGDLNAVIDAIAPRVGQCDPGSHRVGVNRLNGSVSQFCTGNGQNS
jgi:hypothetical protein